MELVEFFAHFIIWFYPPVCVFLVTGFSIHLLLNYVVSEVFGMGPGVIYAYILMFQRTKDGRFP